MRSPRLNGLRKQRLHLLLVDALDQLIDQAAGRHRDFGGLGQFEHVVHVLLGPFADALAPTRQRPVGAAAFVQRGDELEEFMPIDFASVSDSNSPP